MIHSRVLVKSPPNFFPNKSRLKIKCTLISKANNNLLTAFSFATPTVFIKSESNIFCVVFNLYPYLKL